MQAQYEHSPPTSSLSTTATRSPPAASAAAQCSPGAPPPNTITSYSSLEFIVTSRSPGQCEGSCDDVLDVRHVPSGGRGRRLRGAAVFARVHVGRIPVPPVMRRGNLLECAVVIGRLMQEL